MAQQLKDPAPAAAAAQMDPCTLNLTDAGNADKARGATSGPHSKRGQVQCLAMLRAGENAGAAAPVPCWEAEDVCSPREDSLTVP